MISWNVVLERIHDELSLPFQVLEKTDPEIIYAQKFIVLNILKHLKISNPKS